MTVTLGTRPDALIVRLTSGADFIATITNQGGAWNPAAVVSLVFEDESVWTATIDGADASWVVDKATADLMPHRAKVELRYTLGTVDQVWARGTVSRSD